MAHYEIKIMTKAKQTNELSQRIWTPLLKSAKGYRPPFADLDSPSELSLLASFVSYLVTNSI